MRQFALILISLCWLLAATGRSAEAVPPVVLCLGDSLTAGYGLEPEQAYPNLLAAKAKAAGLTVQFVNAGSSGETTAGGLRRLNWLLRQRVTILVVALGGNDGLRGVEVGSSQENLRQLVRKARDIQPGIKIVLAGMQVPPSMGAEYAAAFRAIFPALAEEEKLTLIPFLLEGVGGVKELNLADGIHPNERGQERLAETVWQTLAPLLRDLPAPAP